MTKIIRIGTCEFEKYKCATTTKHRAGRERLKINSGGKPLSLFGTIFQNLIKANQKDGKSLSLLSSEDEVSVTVLISRIKVESHIKISSVTRRNCAECTFEQNHLG